MEARQAYSTEGRSYLIWQKHRKSINMGDVCISQCLCTVHMKRSAQTASRSLGPGGPLHPQTTKGNICNSVCQLGLKKAPVSLYKDFSSQIYRKSKWLRLCNRNELSSVDNQALSLWKACKLNYSQAVIFPRHWILSLITSLGRKRVKIFLPGHLKPTFPTPQGEER